MRNGGEKNERGVGIKQKQKEACDSKSQLDFFSWNWNGSQYGHHIQTSGIVEEEIHAY